MFGAEVGGLYWFLSALCTALGAAGVFLVRRADEPVEIDLFSAAHAGNPGAEIDVAFSDSCVATGYAT